MLGRLFYDNRDAWSLSSKLRRRRFCFFKDMVDSLSTPIQILDVGGEWKFWQMMDFVGVIDVEIIILNSKAVTVGHHSFHSVIGDARCLPFGNDEFDIVFSNSVIEHVGGYGQQQRMASEVRRVGERYFVQTPNYFFPLEPHFLFPCFHWLPLEARVLLIQNFDLGWVKKIPDSPNARKLVESINLLKRQELVDLFPDALIYEEKLLGLVKSFVVYSGWQ